MNSDKGIATEVVGGGGRNTSHQPNHHPLFSIFKKTSPTASVYNIKDIAFYGCSAIIRNRNCTISIDYATVFGQFTAAFHFF